MMTSRIPIISCFCSTLVLILLFGAEISAQIYDTSWVLMFGIQQSGCVIQKHDGGLLVSGIKTERAWLANVAPNGDVLWTKSFFIVENVFGGPYCLETKDGNFVILCTDSENNKARLVKINSSGVEMWSKTYESGDSIYPIITGNLFETQDSGFVFYTSTAYELDRPISFFRIDKNGNQKTCTKIPKTTFYTPTRMTSLKNGSFLISVCYSAMYGKPLDSMQLIKIDPMGNVLWRRTLTEVFDINIDYEISCMVELEDRRILLTGLDFWSENHNSILLILDSTGICLGKRVYKGLNIRDVLLHNDKTLAISGVAYRFNSDAVSGLYFSLFEISTGNFSQARTFGVIDFGGCTMTRTPTGYAIFSKDLGLLNLAINDPPVFTVGTSAVRISVEDSQFTEVIAATDPFSNDRLVWYFVNSPTPGMVVDSLTGRFTWTPAASADSGLHTVVLGVRDRVGQKDTVQFQINVIPVNDKPSIVSISPLTISEGMSVIWNPSVNDEETDILSYSWHFDGTLIGTDSSCTFTPGYSDSGNHVLRIRVSDNHSTAESSMTVKVLNTPVPPHILNPDSISVALTTSLLWGWTTPGRDPNLDVSSLTYQVRIRQYRNGNYTTLMSPILFSNGTLISQIDGAGRLGSGTIYIAVEATDGNGYRTGFKEQAFTYNPPASQGVTSGTALPGRFSVQWFQHGLLLAIPLQAGGRAVCTVSAADIQGRCLFKRDLADLQPGYHQFRLPVAIQSSGCYLVFVKFAGEQWVMKVANIRSN